MSRYERRSLTLVHKLGLALLATAALAACAPGGGSSASSASSTGADSSSATPGNSGGGQSASGTPISTDVSAAGDVVLTITDFEQPPGVGTALPKINAAFEKKYPNVKINRQITDFNSWQTKSKLALSAPDAPCVAEGGQGFSFDGPLVAAKLIRPLDDYAQLYGWTTTFKPSVLDQLRFNAAGTKFGAGDLYGISPAGEITGWFYNKKLLNQVGGQVPQTLGDLDKLLAAAKQNGVQPITLGDLDKWPASHIFSNLASAGMPADDVLRLVFGSPDAKWSTPEWQAALVHLQKWVKDGYVQKGWAGLSADDATAKFAAGKSLLLEGGTWLNGTLTDKMSDNVGWFITPPADGQPSAATGALSPPFHITTACKHPDVAAAYLNFLISPEAQQMVAAAGNIASNLPNPTASTPVGTDTLKGFAGALSTGTLTPYIDWTTVKTGDILFGGLQELLAGRTSPSDLLAKLEADRNAAISTS